MSFEERLLMELKNEIVARRRKVTVRRLLAGAAAAGIAATVAVAAPQLLGGETPAYAVTQRADGVYVQVNEFRDADKLEADLAARGIKADVTYIELGKRCAAGRGQVAGEDKVIDPKTWQNSPSAKAVRPDRKGVLIKPEYVGAGQTVMMEFTENTGRDSGEERVLRSFWGVVIEGEVKPCVLEDDPDWADPGRT
ncbi:hypothetical protein [Nonomuraea endophytica]|uniref:Uncharacterized protein n=1 Tax=Nonomuraea endophytica TaxID=714136 RepID=A0A7W8EIR1_9ACTN|nr:hypothetical protein [Nonomuraea endophytica]MBB5080828.1 hypothetical protein [Nonomuraea endophytica]